MIVNEKENKNLKIFQKTFKNLLTNRSEYAIIYTERKSKDFNNITFNK